MKIKTPWLILGAAAVAAVALFAAVQAAPDDDASSGKATATFAGGCFWCMEEAFEKLDGVESVISGYTGGAQKNPSYKEVSSGTTGHAEAIEVRYDPARISYEDLLWYFWRNVDPFAANRQFCDGGSQYRPEIFVDGAAQRSAAEASKAEVAVRFDEPIVVEITDAEPFYAAEDYHQDYYDKNPVRYKLYKTGCGRARRLESIWGDEAGGAAGKPPKVHTSDADNNNLDIEKKLMNFEKPSDDELRKSLSDLQYQVTQHEGTEPPFRNDYWDNHEDGIYVDVVSGEPLFSSSDKYESGTGWPSFTKPIDERYVNTKRDFKLVLPRTEVRSRNADSHLGHVFKDGPAPTGLRYCMNSAAMRFIPADKLEEEGYGEYLSLFEGEPST